jgi:hypothetical protein
LRPFDYFERARNRNFLDGVMALAGREARFDANEAAEFARWLRLCESHADPRLPAPDNEAMLALLAGDNIQCDFVGYAYGARHVQRRSRRGHVTDGAIDPAAVELNRSGLEDPLPLFCASLFHCPAFKLKV